MPKRGIVIAISVFFVFNIMITYFVAADFLNKYIDNFGRTFLSELLAILGNAAILAILCVIFFSIVKKIHRRIMTLGIISILLVIFIFALSIYTKYYSSFFSFSTLTVFKNPAVSLGMTVLTDSLKNFFVEFYFLLLIPGIGLIIYSNILKKQQYTYSLNNKKHSRLFRLAIILLALIFSITSILVSSNKAKRDWPYNSDLSLYTIQNIGVYNYYVSELIGINFTHDYTKQYSETEVLTTVSAFNSLSSDYDNPFETSVNSDIGNGLFAGKNLYLLQLESVNSFFIDNKINNEYIMPNLKNISENSYNFSNFYTNSGQGVTADAELALITGIRASGYTTLHWDYEKTKYEFETLPNLFSDLGYKTCSFHGDTELFYNRTPIHEDLFGFDEYLSKEDYLLTHPNKTDDPDSFVGDWVSDEVMLNWSYDYLDELTDPFFAYNIMTVSHTPYKFNPYEDNYEWPGINSSLLKRYLSYMCYVDEYLGRLFTKMQSDTDTVYVIVGDHGCGINNGDLEQILGDMSYFEMLQYLNKVPAMIYDASGSLETLMSGDMNQELLRSEVDLNQTITNMFSLNPKLSFNINALSNDKTFTYLPAGFYIITDEYFSSMKNPSQIVIFNNYSNNEIEIEIDYIKRFKLAIDMGIQMNIYKKFLN